MPQAHPGREAETSAYFVCFRNVRCRTEAVLKQLALVSKVDWSVKWSVSKVAWSVSDLLSKVVWSVKWSVSKVVWSVKWSGQ